MARFRALVPDWAHVPPTEIDESPVKELERLRACHVGLQAFADWWWEKSTIVERDAWLRSNPFCLHRIMYIGKDGQPRTMNEPIEPDSRSPR